MYICPANKVLGWSGIYSFLHLDLELKPSSCTLSADQTSAPPPRAHDLQQEHVLDCRSHLQRSGKPFQCGMSISFSHFL